MEKSNENTEEIAEEKLPEIVIESITSEENEQSNPHDHAAQSSVKNAGQLVEEARSMVYQSDHEVKDCMEILDEDIDLFEEKKSALIKGSMHTTEALLSEIGFEPEEVKDIGEEGVKFGREEPIKPVQIRDLSSGKFSAFLMALIAGFLVIAGWIYIATEKLSMTLDVSKIPAQETQNKLLTWIGGGVTGAEGNPMVGIAILAFSALLVMWLVYKLRVYLRGVKNQKLAQKINEDAKFYCTQKEECKEEMKKVSEHIRKVTASLHTYDLFFDELNAKMRRVLHLEGKLPFNEFHPKSKEDMKRANILINSLGDLISTPMAGDNGSLSEEGKEVLRRSDRTLELYREKLYQ